MTSRYVVAPVFGWKVASLAVLSLLGCGDKPSSPEDLTLFVVPASATLDLGFQERFQAILRDATGQDHDTVQASWTSSAPDVVSIEQDGLATAVGPGAAVISAEASAGIATSSVTVLPVVFTTVSAGTSHTCGVTDRGVGYCWGNNDWGAVGDSTREDDRLSPRPVVGSIDFRQVAAGAEHSCGVSHENAAYCWGRGLDGRLGDSTDTGYRLTPHPVAAPPLATIHTGAQFTCGLTPTGEAYCWGENDWGSVGDGTTVTRTAPVPVAGDLTFAGINTGQLHTCGLTPAGEAYCWGRGDSGQLGEDRITDRSVPVPVDGGLTFRTISAGRSHTCGVTTDGVAYCWGDNHHGKLGTGTPEDEWIPTPVETDLRFEAVLAGGSISCGLTDTGAAYCWGYNLVGSLGRPPDEVAESDVPMAVTGGHIFTWVTVRSGHTCGLATDDIVYCWGANPFGQLGIGEYSVGSYEPVPIFGQR